MNGAFGTAAWTSAIGQERKFIRAGWLPLDRLLYSENRLSAKGKDFDR
jgi:hypothetical protein